MDDTLATKYAMLIVSIANGTASEMDDPKGREICQDIVGKVKTKKPADRQVAVQKISVTLTSCRITADQTDHQKIYDQILKLI